VQACNNVVNALVLCNNPYLHNDHVHAQCGEGDWGFGTTGGEHSNRGTQSQTITRQR